MFIIGIDPGVKTGVAIWCTDDQKFYDIQTTTILEAMTIVNDCRAHQDVILIVEDARQRKWYGNNAAAKRMGAGSIKRDCQVWEEYAELNQVPYIMQPPKRGSTKLDAKTFKNITRHEGRTSEHARDAAMMVYNLSENQAKILIDGKR